MRPPPREPRSWRIAVPERHQHGHVRVPQTEWRQPLIQLGERHRRGASQDVARKISQGIFHARADWQRNLSGAILLYSIAVVSRAFFRRERLMSEATEADTVAVEVREAIAWVKFNRPEKRNSM